MASVGGGSLLARQRRGLCVSSLADSSTVSRPPCGEHDHRTPQELAGVAPVVRAGWTPCVVGSPTPVRLTHRALEGGPAAPSNAFFVTIQGRAVTSGRRERSSPSLSALCGHPRHCRATPSTVTTSQCCWSARGQDVATVLRTGPR
jgi:hypothetical protein